MNGDVVLGMREIVLSDHPGSMAAALEGKRVAEHQAALDEHQHKVDAIRAKRERLIRQADEALSRLNLFTYVGATLSRLGLFLRGTPEQPKMPPTTNAEHVWQAGAEGEALVTERLGASLDDTWTMLSGYRNRGGEIDRVLVGPKGILAIEIKHNTGVISVEGEQWRRDKYDNYGNFLGQERIADRKGRSPSQQINASADKLEEFLLKFGSPATHVYRAIVFPHPKADAGDIDGLTIDWLWIGSLGLQGAPSVIGGMDESLDPAACQRVVNLIVRDHRHHETRQASRNLHAPAR